MSRSPDGVFFSPVDVLSLPFSVLGRSIALLFELNDGLDRPGVIEEWSVEQFGGEEG